eukprot:TRINITY_DN5547_c0_g1_i1.p1 TRINITY_DN5547_c0_g1~~TRINITY_DN5547_c0_g1_i1.p1  ORF type:complete len:189 (+),score=77.36 TRINITY_DN5547_c0_g1_i1:207-773(+)
MIITKESEVTTDPRERLKKESDPKRLASRQKQIDFGKNTIGYDNYINSVSREKRTKEHPSTPDKYQVCSKRSWDGQIRKWRRQLHTFDPSSKGKEFDEKEFEDEDGNEDGENNHHKKNEEGKNPKRGKKEDNEEADSKEGGDEKKDGEKKGDEKKEEKEDKEVKEEKKAWGDYDSEDEKEFLKTLKAK